MSTKKVQFNIKENSDYVISDTVEVVDFKFPKNKLSNNLKYLKNLNNIKDYKNTNDSNLEKLVDQYLFNKHNF